MKSLWTIENKENCILVRSIVYLGREKYSLKNAVKSRKTGLQLFWMSFANWILFGMSQNANPVLILDHFISLKVVQNAVT